MSPLNSEFPVIELGKSTCWILNLSWMRKWLEANQSTSRKVKKHLWKNNLLVIIHDIIILHGQFRLLSLVSVETFSHETLNIAQGFWSMQEQVESCPKSACSYTTLGPRCISGTEPHIANAPTQGGCILCVSFRKKMHQPAMGMSMGPVRGQWQLTTFCFLSDCFHLSEILQAVACCLGFETVSHYMRERFLAFGGLFLW